MVQVLRLKNYRILCSFPIFPLLLVSTLLRHLDLIEDRSAIGSQKVDPRSRRIIFFVFLSKKLYLQPEVWLGSGELSRKSNRKLGCISHSGGIAIFVNRLFCDWQSEPAICDDVLVSSFTSFIQITEFIIWCRPMQYLILWSDLLHLQDQENIIFHVLMERKITLSIFIYSRRYSRIWK